MTIVTDLPNPAAGTLTTGAYMDLLAQRSARHVEQTQRPTLPDGATWREPFATTVAKNPLLEWFVLDGDELLLTPEALAEMSA